MRIRKEDPKRRNQSSHIFKNSKAIGSIFKVHSSINNKRVISSVFVLIIVVFVLFLVPRKKRNDIDYKVYVYELPSKYNTDVLSLIEGNNREQYRKYEAERDLHERFLKIATKDPNEATFFFVPVYTSAIMISNEKRYRQSVRDMTRSKVLEVLRFIQDKYPFWDRKGGQDHVWAFTYDQGICLDIVSDRSQESKPSQSILSSLKDSIVLTHISDIQNECFQKTSRSIVVPPYVPAEQITKRRNEAKRGKWNQRLYFATFRGKMSLENPRNRWESINMLYGSKEEQNLVSPTSSGYDACWHMMSSNYASCSTSCESELLRTRIYSRGTRQHIKNIFENDKDFHISSNIMSISKYWDELSMSTFCLCPPSMSSITPRIFEAIAMGCVPVIITKDSTRTKLPFQNLVDWSSISVQISDVDIPFLGIILKSISNSELDSKRRAMERFWNMFLGGKSFRNVFRELISASPSSSSLRSTNVLSKNKNNNNDMKVIDMRPQDKFWTYAGFARIDITITTQMSLDRASQLEVLLNMWKGPVTVAIYLRQGETLTNSEYGKQIQSLLDTYDERRLRCAIVEQQDKNEYYPVNRLRNVALSLALTEFIAFVDADFSVPEQMYENLMKHIRRFDRSSELKTALVIPAFQTNLHFLPSTKASMKSAIRKKTVKAFQQDGYPSGHYATNTKRWLDSDRPYEISYRFGYEPFLVLRRPAPYYDERFVGYGQNKVSYAYELAARNYRFVVLPDVYIIHTYDESETNKKRKDWTVGWSCWRDFAKDIQRLYNGFHPVEPCWVSQYIWPKVIKSHGDQCVV